MSRKNSKWELYRRDKELKKAFMNNVFEWIESSEESKLISIFYESMCETYKIANRDHILGDSHSRIRLFANSIRKLKLFKFEDKELFYEYSLWSDCCLFKYGKERYLGRQTIIEKLKHCMSEARKKMESDPDQIIETQTKYLKNLLNDQRSSVNSSQHICNKMDLINLEFEKYIKEIRNE